MSLRDEAMSWAAETVSPKLDSMTSATVLDAMIRRFGKLQDTDLTLSRFIASHQPESRVEYSHFLLQALTIF
ncbi:hypothetical protein GVAV_001144 [Gurleya vavrai]